MLQSRLSRLAVAASALAVGFGGLAATSGSAAASSSPLTVAMLESFTGPNAFFGASSVVSCTAASKQIDSAGGVMGHPLSCQQFDDKGDPADAVPVTTRMVAENPTMVMGPDGIEMPAVFPLINQAKIPSMNVDGDPSYDHQKSKYFYRTVPSDSSAGPALAWYIIHKLHIKKVAEVFETSSDSQEASKTFLSSFKKDGGKVTINISIPVGSTSYSTEVARAIAAGGQALAGEWDGPTGATFLSEWQQQAGKLPPVITTQQAEQSVWEPAVGPAIGVSTLAKDVTAVAPQFITKGVAYTTYVHQVIRDGGKATDASAYSAAYYDATIIFSLAMDMAKSTDPSTYNKYIRQVTAKKSGAEIVHTYKAGVAAIKAHKKFTYVGAEVQAPFNKYGTVLQPYAALRYNRSIKQWVTIATIPGSATSS